MMNLPFVRLILWSLLVILTVAGITTIGSIDPFRHLNQEFYEAGMGQTGVRILSPELKLTAKGVPVLNAKAERLDLAKNRQEWTLIDVRDGRFYDDGVPKADFSSNAIRYNTISQSLSAERSSFVFSDGKLTFDSMVWDRNMNSVEWRTPVVGTYKGGAFQSQNGKILLKTESLTAGQGSWSPQLGDTPDKRVQLNWNGIRMDSKSPVAQLDRATIKYDDVQATADKANVDTKTNTIQAEGNVLYENAEFTLVGKSAMMNLTTKRTAIVGDPVVKGQDKKKTYEIRFTDGELDNKTGIYHLKNVEVIDGETTMKADVADYDKTKNIVSAVGNVYLNDAEVEITAQKAEINRKDKIAVITTDVKINIKPKQEPPTDANSAVPSETPETRKHPVKVSADSVDYYYGKQKTALLKGNISAKQDLNDNKWRSITADNARYEREEEKLTLMGSVSYKDSEGIEIYPQKLVAYLKDGSEKVEITGIQEGKKSVIVLDENEEGEGAAPPPP